MLLAGCGGDDPANQRPVAYDAYTVTDEDESKTFPLIADDPDGLIESYQITSDPPNGTIEPDGEEWTYTPDADYNGTDSFEYTATDDDGAVSNPAVVTISIAAVNDPPVAVNQSVETDEDVAVEITLEATDVDGDDIATWQIDREPVSGSLTGTAPDLTYEPDPDFNGTDSFSFTASDDSGGTSEPATVEITVVAVNDAPVALEQSIVVDEDTAVEISVGGIDIDGDELAGFQLDTRPLHGILVGELPDLTYWPEENYAGPDSLAFTVTDLDGATSAPGTVSITVMPVEDAPRPTDLHVEVLEDTWVDIILQGTDVDGDEITEFQLSSGPLNGTLHGEAPAISYLPHEHFHGSDSFRFTVTDPLGLQSDPGVVSIEVIQVNDPPESIEQQSTLDEGATVSITLEASDPDGTADIDSFNIVRSPAAGTLEGEADRFEYTPNSGFTGFDFFEFTVTDRAGAVSLPAQIGLTVLPVSADERRKQIIQRLEEAMSSSVISAKWNQGPEVSSNGIEIVPWIAARETTVSIRFDRPIAPFMVVPGLELVGIAEDDKLVTFRMTHDLPGRDVAALLITELPVAVGPTQLDDERLSKLSHRYSDSAYNWLPIATIPALDRSREPIVRDGPITEQLLLGILVHEALPEWNRVRSHRGHHLLAPVYWDDRYVASNLRTDSLSVVGGYVSVVAVGLPESPHAGSAIAAALARNIGISLLSCRSSNIVPNAWLYREERFVHQSDMFRNRCLGELIDGYGRLVHLRTSQLTTGPYRQSEPGFLLSGFVDQQGEWIITQTERTDWITENNEEGTHRLVVAGSNGESLYDGPLALKSVVGHGGEIGVQVWSISIPGATEDALNIQVIDGIGNYLVDESLAPSAIDPRRDPKSR